MGQRALYFVGLGIGRLIYRVSSMGRENFPDGGFLLLPNHISFVDAIVLQMACPRRIRYIVDEGFYKNRWLHPVLELAGCIRSRPVAPRKRCVWPATVSAPEILCVFS